MWMTEDDAKANLCPLVRTFGKAPEHAGCRGPDCAVWRWERITTAHPLWAAAVRSEAEKLGERQPFPKSARIVSDNPAAFGLVPIRGHCGLGGQP